MIYASGSLQIKSSVDLSKHLSNIVKELIQWEHLAQAKWSHHSQPDCRQHWCLVGTMTALLWLVKLHCETLRWAFSPHLLLKLYVKSEDWMWLRKTARSYGSDLFTTRQAHPTEDPALSSTFAIWDLGAVSVFDVQPMVANHNRKIRSY